MTEIILQGISILEERYKDQVNAQEGSFCWTPTQKQINPDKEIPDMKKTASTGSATVLAALLASTLMLLLLAGPAGTAEAAETAETVKTAEQYGMPESTAAVSPASAVPVRTEEIYGLESDLVYTYKMKQSEGLPEIRELLAKMKAASPELGETWERIMNYWVYANEDMIVHEDVLPDGLPEDDSLCIVVLGYQLEPDGTMSEELIGRCETALRSAKKYPNAYIAVTGGGTALMADTTEAEAMAAWLTEKGIAPERIITENSSLTTGENAQFTCKIISEAYPQIRWAAVISSDYHVPLGCLLFEEQFLLSSAYNGTEPVEVLSNAGFRTNTETYGGISGVKNQAAYVWKLCDSFPVRS